jgi:hypothetical protein
MSRGSLIPFVVLGAGFVWYGLFAWLRRRLPAEPKPNSLTPQQMVLWGLAGLVAAMMAAAAAAMVLWK